MTGGMIAGILLAFDIPRKAIANQAGIHESTLGRKINGKEDFQADELLRVGIAIGEEKTKKALQKTAIS